MTMSRRRSLGTAQIGMRMMNIFVRGSLGTPTIAPLGFDRLNVKSITRTSAGIYVITFKTAFIRNVTPFIQNTSVAIVAPTITSASATSVTVRNMTAAADFDFNLLVIGSEFGYDVAG